jgi:hypothetical protein
MPAVRDQVFISYSHKDREWLSKLQTMLKPGTQQDHLGVGRHQKVYFGVVAATILVFQSAP